MTWETVVGIETHAHLLTKSKIFSGASTAFGAAPNTQACAVDIALPGVLPVLNARVVEHAVRFGLAIGANISRRWVSARKNYFYPDLPKGYQISQYEIPVVQGGQVEFIVGGGRGRGRGAPAHPPEGGRAVGWWGARFCDGKHGGGPLPLHPNRLGAPPGGGLRPPPRDQEPEQL